MLRILTRRTPILIVSLAVLIVSSAAQTIKSQEIPADKLATFVFDVDAKRIQNNELLKQLNINTLMLLMDLEGMMPPNGKIEDLTRFCGAIQLSKPIDLMANQTSWEFYFQLHFETEAQLERVKEGLSNFQELGEVNGKMLYSMDGGEKFCLIYDGTMLEVGTGLYLRHPNRDLLTEKLAARWKDMPEVGGKLAFDVAASREFIEGFREEFIRSIPIEGLVEPVLDQFTENVDMIAAHADLDNQEAISLTVLANNEEARDSLKGVADGLLFMVALPLKNVINMVPVESKKGKEMLMGIADQLKAEKIDGGIGMTVLKPETFEDVMKSEYLPEIQKRMASFQLKDDLRNIGNAINRMNVALPFVKSDSEDWHGELSWRVRIVNEMYLTRELAGLSDISESWEHESNQALIDKMPGLFGPQGQHSNLVWVESKVKTREEITDGAYNTIAILRLPEPTSEVWTDPAGDSVSMLAAIKLVKNLRDGETIFAITYGTRIIELNNQMSHNELKAYFTPASGDGPNRTKSMIE
jgi:hypothetical protein